MPQQVLNPLSNYGRSGSVLLLNPTDRVNRYRYLKTPAELRSAPVIRGVPPTYIGAAASALTTVSPATGTTAGGTGVTLTGTGFIEATGVTFGGTPATGVIINSSTQITCLTPPHSAGAVDVVVQDPLGNGTKTGGFTYS
jgi:hypothetical protein